MSTYATLDHAAWMQQEIERIKQRKPIRGKLLPSELSEFQKRVCNIVGIIGGGLYNAPINIEKINWDFGGGVSLYWTRELSTWDFSQLTLLVFLCHEARIRLQVEAYGPRATKLSFWQRKATGDIAVRHPNLDEAVADFRKWFSSEHQINYKENESSETSSGE